MAAASLIDYDNNDDVDLLTRSSLKYMLTRKGLTPLHDHDINSRNNYPVTKESEFCRKCDEEIDEVETMPDGSTAPTAIACDMCKSYYHSDCSGISQELFQMVTKYGTNGSGEIPWYCKVCKKYAGQLVSEMASLRHKHENLETEVNLIKARVSKLENQGAGSPVVFEGVRDVVLETLEQQKRQLNLVISNFPSESSAPGVVPTQEL